MHAHTDLTEFETTEAFFHYPCGHPGTHRSLSSLWELFHGTAAVHPYVPAGTLLQSSEETIMHSRDPLQTRAHEMPQDGKPLSLFF